MLSAVRSILLRGVIMSLLGSFGVGVGLSDELPPQATRSGKKTAIKRNLNNFGGEEFRK